MECQGVLLHFLSIVFILSSLFNLARFWRTPAFYGRYQDPSGSGCVVPAKVAWFLQELPAFLCPLLLLLFTSNEASAVGMYILFGMFGLHYFHRTFIYAPLTCGQPFPVDVMVSGAAFCTGSILFYLGMAINIHSDRILRNLRKPDEKTYKIPRGGLFEYVSCANYFGEILEWLGYAIAACSLPSFSFTFFSWCFIIPRAHNHHRFYHEKFEDYPKSRRCIIPFIY
ncbi:3-oxo-5-alpha-steroid 4-dehydrogenase 2-like isoform X2 [Alosa alosa]|uniref:3-oxo-5-alpha-steroid 4-dehydrogenase 2-like isoform X2 n=1 Tax=Alosa sapidissima TaxID=34773 RepID=UPI001C08D5C1|nr:3-oxo-5-alpha-steroid 4-dehydrogenase 2-like isoform X2 [Alosa sapidissima]XP_048126120.1 3-oxo-5-alpha-steroid 4-dehydrogenase 2-like isoform X2 [Alosa alosa]